MFASAITPPRMKPRVGSLACRSSIATWLSTPLKLRAGSSIVKPTPAMW
jgi:hypothetical protein